MNHLFAALLAYIKLETIKIRSQIKAFCHEIRNLFLRLKICMERTQKRKKNKTA
jgi:hypothetical protein